jgi:hypothetical protein
MNRIKNVSAQPSSIEEILLEILSNTELSKIRKLRQKGGFRHPFQVLLAPVSNNGQLVVNTQRALAKVLQKDKAWLASLRPRFIDKNDYAAAAGALAEVRAFGMLLDVVDDVTYPKIGEYTPAAKPDFLVQHQRQSILVEVNCRQPTGEMADAMEDFRKGWSKNKKLGASLSEQNGIYISTILYSPLGNHKEAISKISQIKAAEHQMSSKLPSILWLDLQDERLHRSLTEKDTLPIYSRQENLFAGRIWYGLYGWKGAQIIEPIHDWISSPDKMTHGGRFQGSKKLSAVIVSFQNSTILLENPNAARPIPDDFRIRLFGLDWFNIEYSLCAFPGGILSDLISTQRQTVRALSKSYKMRQRWA